MNSRKPERCIYGWKCKRKFCKFSHEYLYSYNKFISSKCDENFATSEHLEEHQQNLHENLKEISENLHHTISETRMQNKEVVIKENGGEEEAKSSSSLSPTTSSSSLSSITSVSSNSSLSTNSSEKEKVGGMSRSNSI